MQNFGPYEDETIDFNKLDQTPVFLIAGNTGSGKTTIFDAITFALFGEGITQDRDPASLRSDFADFDSPTRVELTFEHQGKKYVIARQPKQTLNKQRGSGQKVYEAKGTLSFFKDDKKVNEIKRISEITGNIERILQLTRQQFVQIVLLPQGDFRKFLAASSSDKETLLRNIFHTDIYRRWSDALNAKLRDMNANAKQWQQAIQDNLASVDWVDAPTDIQAQSTENQIQALKAQQKVAKADLAALKAKVDDAQDQITKQSSKINADEQMNTQIKELENKRQALTQLSAKKADYDKLKQGIDQLTWAKDLKPKYDHFQELQATIQNFQAKLATVTNELADHKVAQKTAEKTQRTLQDKQRAQAELKDRIPVLTKQRQSFKKAADLAQSLSDSEGRLADLKKQLTATNQSMADLQQQTAQIDADLKQRDPLKDRRYLLKQTSDQLTNYKQQLKDLWHQNTENQNLEAQVSAAKTALLTAKKQVAATQTNYDDLRNDWLQNQIMNLVDQLKDGTPCPVCGSLDHPAPAHVVDVRTVSNAQMKAAQNQLQAVKDTATQQESQLANQTAQLTKQTQQFQTTFAALIAEFEERKITENPISDLQSAVQVIKNQINQNQRAISDIDDQLQELADKAEKQDHIKQQLSALMEKSTNLNSELQTNEKDLAKTKGTLETIQADLPAEFKDLSTLDTYLTEITDSVQHYENAVKANNQDLNQISNQISESNATIKGLNQNIKDNQQKLTAVQELITNAIQKQFGTAEWSKFESCLEQLSHLADYQQQAKDYQQQVQSAKVAIETYEKNIGDHKPVDLEAERAKLAQLTQVRDDLNAESKVQNNRYILNGNSLKQINKSYKDIHNQQEKLTQLEQLVSTVTGNNDAKLGLERYVLRAQLAEILNVANEHLKQLSSGRYHLLLHKESGTYQKDTGLEIDVYDDTVGETRSVHTLSGGESFIVALSLALALGEVIQNEAGGISIDTLFVDEGFGSLDQSSLATAMAALENIESSNRTIGIISHVAMLKDSIPCQIQVQTVGQGKSAVKMVGVWERPFRLFWNDLIN